MTANQVKSDDFGKQDTAVPEIVSPDEMIADGQENVTEDEADLNSGHVSVLEPENGEEDDVTANATIDSEDIPNKAGMGLPLPEDTGKSEERLSGHYFGTEKLPVPDVRNILHRMKKGSRSDAQGAQDKSDVKQHQSVRKLLRPHFGSRRSGSISNQEGRHGFSEKFMKGLRKLKLPPTKPKKHRTVESKNIADELELRDTKKAQFTVQSLITAYPEALLFSSYFLNDDHTQRKVPILLCLLSSYIAEVPNPSNSKTKLFKFYLEYGVGDRALEWTVTKDLKQIVSFHNKLKILILQANVISKGTGRRELTLPKFPKMKPIHTFSSNFENFDLSHVNNNDTRNCEPCPNEMNRIRSADRLALQDTERNEEFGLETRSPLAAHSVHSSLTSLSSSSSSILSDAASLWRHGLFRKRKQDRNRGEDDEILRLSLQNYFDKLNSKLLLRPESVKLLQFFELSPMSVLLSQEDEKKRKEGYLFIKTSAKAQGWRVGHLKYRDFKAMVVRHTSKWFILGHSYIMYVADIDSTTPLDVFLIDPKFKATLSGFSDIASKSMNSTVAPKQELQRVDYSDDDDEIDDENEVKYSQKSTKKTPYFSMTLENGERKLSVMSRSGKQLKNWYLSICDMSSNSEWSSHHRFESFAPVRNDCFAQWFVDARDYMWAASSAMEMAKDVIYIHDWWLSPELYLRRPAEGNQEWRLDRLLKRKAEQGVKIFIIIYRNVGNTVVTDSLWTKHSLLNLHPNIHVMRSPNQLMQNVYFWAHHEKLLIVDQMVCFLGGVDLCYGRWDTPGHSLVDDSPYSFKSQVPESLAKKGKGIAYQLHPGKDYSNPRVRDFYDLQSPFEDMYNRQITPRMPWHDVHMVTCGQIARDLSRHFVQRWNYLLRQKRPSRPTPLLLPPRNFTPDELKQYDFTGTCEIQLLRSSCFWSLGLQNHEQSIQNAYIKCIETSEHFVYLENQFFVTSCEVDGVMILNRIGDALVDRIITAHHRKETWKAIIVIPLLPGFESDVDLQEGSSVRLITRCQYMSISMGDSSIFAKLRKVGISPDDYIQFYSLRRWGMIGVKRLLVTEQLYIHAKVMIVDDRIAVIGSANINERSMRGTRDSEVCAIVRDKDMIESHMDGKPYSVGRFPHTLRVRLMREHLGVDIDLLDLVERRFSSIEQFASSSHGLNASTLSLDQSKHSRVLSAMVELGTRYLLKKYDGTDNYRCMNKSNSFGKQLTALMLETFKEKDPVFDKSEPNGNSYIYSFNHRAGKENVGIRDKKPFSTDSRVTTKAHRDDVNGYGEDMYQSTSYLQSKVRLNTFMKRMANEATEDCPLPTYEDILEFLNDGENVESIDILNKERWVMLKRLFYMQKLEYKKMQMRVETDVSPKEEKSTAESQNTENDIPAPSIPKIALSDLQINEIDKNILPQTVSDFIDPYAFEDPLDIDFFEGTWMPLAIRNTMIYQMVFHTQPDDSVSGWKDYKQFQRLRHAFMDHQKISRGFSQESPSEEERDDILGQHSSDSSENQQVEPQESPDESTFVQNGLTDDLHRQILRRARMADLDRFQRESGVAGILGQASNLNLVGSPNGIFVFDYDTAKKLLQLVRGRIVKFPTRWLKKEIEGSNWFYKADKLPPIQIYD